MSNALAVATVTATLRQMLQPAISRAVPGAQVRNLRPDLVAADRSLSGINLFLYQVVPNATYRNQDLPTRRFDGSLASRPQAAIDLLYLISCYGADDLLEPQRLLGATVAALHAWPSLPTSEITAAVAAEPLVLDGSDLAQQSELIHVTMEPLTTEELSRLWSTFGSVPYTLSIAYRVSVLLLEQALVPHVVKPVEQVHPTVLATDEPAATLAGLAPGAPP